MKIQNKKTGEIPDKIETIVYIQWSKKIMMVYINSDGERILKYYDSLEAFNEEWEDVPEESIKPYWFINDLDGEPMKCDLKNCGKSNFIEWGNHRKQIGNYFDTREEAEKAVEKLKAWKRLKDKGFRVTLQSCKNNAWLQANWGNLQGDYSDALLLFGGEE